MSNRTVEFWFDFASPYSYLAVMRIESIAHQHGCELLWKPFLLGPIFKAQGWDDSPFKLYPAKGRYMWRDLERVCTELDIPLVRPTAYPRNSVLAARVACLGEGSVWLPSFAKAVFSANFACDLDISKAEVVRACLESVVPDPGAVMSAANDEEHKGRLRMNVEQAMSAGIFGAPSFVVGKELFWGNDRMADAMRWASVSATE